MTTQAGEMLSGAIAATPGTAGRILRFTRTERAVHWVQATSFLLLLISGFVLALPQFEATIGHRELLREIHLTSAFLFFFGPAIVALSGDRRSVARDVEEVDTWDADDLRWLVPGGKRPAQGRFNAGQKLNAIFVAWSTVTFTITGLIMWQNRRFDTDLVSKANTIHTALAYLALFAFLGHIFLATAYPATRPALRGIVEGWVRSDWAEQHHAKWARQAMAPVSSGSREALRTAMQILLGAFVCLFAVRVLFFAMGANVTDRVTERLYDVTAWPGAASLQPQTGVHVTDWYGLGYGILCILAWLAVDRFRRAEQQ
ncbi:MAG TPA: cytochrome b/b6 domain-containing protein [Chloroflexota bacterium]|nr:cytochrome b/b6 domain-containing protein [Chloroflexota bacterium]